MAHEKRETEGIHSFEGKKKKKKKKNYKSEILLQEGTEKSNSTACAFLSS